MRQLILLSNKNESLTVSIFWKSRAIPTVCKSVKDSETRAADKCVKDSIYIVRCFKEINYRTLGESQISADILTGSCPLIDSLESTKQVENKILRPLIKYIKQCLYAHMIRSLHWCDTKVCLY